MGENTKNTKSEVALREEAVLKFWKENEIFEKSLTKPAPKGDYIFYDGPPFATGLMHYGHILGSTAKDAVGRYQTMRGYHVPRKWGWDCHGLPIENIVEKDLGIAGHKEIEALGIEKFVEHARSKVLQYDKDWESSVERIGRWVDFKGGYKTMDNTFIESVWWAFSELNKKGLVYEGVRVLAYCARCETPIANSEIAMDNSYKDIADISIYVKFELEDEPGTYLLAWTTTPWTLPGNTAIAINKNINYVKVKVGGDMLILAKESLEGVLKGKEYSVIGEVKTAELIGKKYKPVFPYYKDSKMPNKENIWKVWHADFVTTEKGTGMAHEAPAFGEDDMNLARENNIPWIIHVDETGRFKEEVKDFAGLKVKPKDTVEDKDAHLRSDIEVIKYLQKTGSYFEKEKIIHSYPHCMRCDTPIIYYALPSWFINIQKVKKDIIKKADTMNWIPSHLKEGRFKNIIENAPDWNVSRNRYWASPLPVWKCKQCSEKTFIGSLLELKAKVKKSRNKYFVMRHGEAENNLLHIASSNINFKHHTTAEGKKQVRDALKQATNIKFDLIFSSPLLRTLETAQMVKDELKIDLPVITDNRITEFNAGIFDGKPIKDWNAFYPDRLLEFTQRPKDGENYNDIKKRVADFLFELESKYKDKNILIISHGDPIWMMDVVNLGLTPKKALEFTKNNYPKNGEIKQLDFIPFPHNKDYELDYHRPYIDKIKLVCTHSSPSGQACKGEMERVPEVLDSWLESGSMPFAQDHFPFENPNWRKNNFPAGFVAEYIAQTRTWFYYTHVVSTVLFGHAPFRNVVTTGTLLASDGQKLSKSKKNYPDPWVFIDKYGVDALRMYLMTSPLMKGEDANFSEKTVQEIASKIIGRLYNVLSFYELYKDSLLEAGSYKLKPSHVLDKWIMARLEQLVDEVTLGMDKYDMNEASRPIEGFVEDLSTWYLRRSRERLKDGDIEAKKTLYYVLKTVAKIIAPIAPFTAEDMWLKLRTEGDKESVHLENWPNMSRGVLDMFSGKKKILKDMQEARGIVSILLKERQQKNIPVRQPLFKATGPSVLPIYSEIIKDEVNIKDYQGTGSVSLDIEITPELKEGGNYRELVRALQDMRKEAGLTPSDTIELHLETNEKGKELVKKFENDIQKTVLVSKIEFKNNDGKEIKIGDLVFKIKIEK